MSFRTLHWASSRIYVLHHDRGMSYCDIAELFHKRGALDQNGQPWAWRLRCPGPPRYHCTNLSKAYHHVEKVLAETGQYP